MTEQQRDQLIEFIGNFVHEMHETMPDLSEMDILDIARVATSVLLGAVMHCAPTSDLAEDVATILRAIIFREYHPGRPGAVVKA